MKNFENTLHQRKGLGVELTFRKDKTEIPSYSASMDWLPPIDNFRQSLRAAASCPVRDRIQKLAWLAGHRLGFVETLQLDRAIEECDPAEAEDFMRLQAALIGSATLQHLIPGIRVAGLRHNLIFDVQAGSYGQYRQEILLPGSFLHAFAPQIVLLSLTARDVAGTIPLNISAQEVENALGHAIAELRALWGAIRSSIKSAIIQQTFLDLSLPVFGSFDRQAPAAPSRIVSRLNDLLADAANQDGVTLLDIAGQAGHDGMEAWFDIRRWFQAKQEIRPEAAAMYGELFARVVAARWGRSRKCLVLDLDNTLWGGVIGDDGPEGIILGAGSAQGEAHLALQHYALRLKERGVILAVCSKNESTIAESAFRDHPEMLLKRSDITAFVANWSDKADNLPRIAEQLNIGIDSLVFVDDNPIERARIREALPVVAVPEMPDDPAGYAPTLAAAGYFEAAAFTQEDRDRAQLYARDAERNALMSVSRSMDEFLTGLEMSVVCAPFGRNDLPRVTQLINKTNQFNTTTRRYTPEEIACKASAPDCLTFHFRLLDRYGDNGIVSAVILCQPNEPGTLEIDTWVMSCRVFGRELEFEIMNIVAEAARQHGAGALVAVYVPTAKNSIIKNLYADLGFSPAEVAHPEDKDLTRWYLDLAGYKSRHTHILRNTSHEP
jgi:FkbH-like protein